MKRPNIVLSGTCHGERYTSPQNPAPRRTIYRTREKHAAKLTRQLNTAFEQSSQRTAHAIADPGGTYLEFRGQQGEQLVTKSLENMSQGIRLLNVREHDDATYATVFIPSGREGYFLKKIGEYADPAKDTDNDNPKNALLITSIEDVRLAIVDSLWTGRPENHPSLERQWVELWLRTPQSEDGSSFTELAALLDSLRITHGNESLLFPERMVTVAKANATDLANLLAGYGRLAEIREAPTATSFFSNLVPGEQREWIDDLLQRATFKPGQTSICILDTGVNAGNPLLRPVVDPKMVLTYDESIGTADRDNHGTKLAGIAAYDDLKAKLESPDPLTVTHVVESVKILDQATPNAVESGSDAHKVYGSIAQQAMARAYIAKPNKKRVFCSAVTATAEEVTDGLPTSWSAALDEEISHADDPSLPHELFLVSAGNIELPMLQGTTYPNANDIRSVRSPGQSWNAVTVGAYSESAWLEEEDIKTSGYEPVAASGELSPYSTTSVQWTHSQAPVKPEIVCPGGNAIAKGGDYSDCQDLSLLTTGARVTSRPLDTISATSAAVAKAAYIAAEIENAYPELWPETVRGLLVHSARWSQQMLDRYCPKGSQVDTMTKGRRRLLRSCGYGIPNLERAIECRENNVNLIIQGTLKPFEVRNGVENMCEMHLHALPWPKKALRELGSTDATLHVTLSYYIEPGPGQIGWKDRYRYASHGLRFDVNKPDETAAEFVHRINVSVRAEDEGKSSSDSGGWFLGKNNRNAGSIHSDYKTASAEELSTIDHIAVYPVIGWWRSRRYLGKIDSLARYSLIVSIETPAIETNLYTEITEAIAASSTIEIAS